MAVLSSDCGGTRRSGVADKTVTGLLDKLLTCLMGLGRGGLQPLACYKVTPPTRLRVSGDAERADESHEKTTNRRPSILESDPLTATTTIITVSIHASSTRADEDEYGPERPHRENQPNLAITDLGQADAIAGENHKR